MTTINERTALESINDMQRSIENLEADWMKATTDEAKEAIDKKIDRLLAMRNGMERLLTDLGIKVDRRDRWEDDKPLPNTIWYLS